MAAPRQPDNRNISYPDRDCSWSWLNAAVAPSAKPGDPQSITSAATGNAAVARGGPVFLDWCEASVSHPFFSAVQFLESARWGGRALREHSALAARLLDAYLEPWSRQGAGRLRDAFALARTLQPLHHALTYLHLLRLLRAEGIARETWERRGVAAHSLGRLMDQLHILPAVR